MRAVVVALMVAAAVGVGAFVLTETAAGYRALAVVALDEGVPTDELDDARSEIVDALPAALERLSGNEAFDPDGVELFMPSKSSRVEVYATSGTPAVAQQVANDVAVELWSDVITRRRTASDLEEAELTAELAAQQRELERAQSLVDGSIADEAIVTRREQEASRVSRDTSEIRQELDAAIAQVQTAAAARDEVADQMNSLRRNLLDVETERLLRSDALFVVTATDSENVSGTPLRNALEAFSIATITFLTAMSVLYLGRRS